MLTGDQGGNGRQQQMAFEEKNKHFMCKQV